MIQFFLSKGPKASTYIHDVPSPFSDGAKSNHTIPLVNPTAVATALDKATSGASLGRKL